MPQGTLLGLLLFIVLINSCCDFDRNISVGSSVTNPPKRFEPSTFCAKFMDDISIAEALNLKEALISDPRMTLPLPYHARFQMKLPAANFKVYSELERIKAFSVSNHMNMNLSKTSKTI